MIEKALRTYLLQQTAVTAIVGNAIYIGRRQDHAGVAAITIANTGASGIYDLAGETTSASPYVPITCWVRGPIRGTLDDLYEAIRLKVSGYRGMWDTVFVQGCTLEAGSGRMLPPLPPQDGDKLWWFPKIMNLNVTHQQTRTTWPAVP